MRSHQLRKHQVPVVLVELPLLFGQQRIIHGVAKADGRVPRITRESRRALRAAPLEPCSGEEEWSSESAITVPAGTSGCRRRREDTLTLFDQRVRTGLQVLHHVLQAMHRLPSRSKTTRVTNTGPSLNSRRQQTQTLDSDELDAMDDRKI